ncbi:unnamed protein product [Didymodactylos carnosus]|uniref:Uncharacterized protein n=1 Tax=Didymodactylos carnosus TaxID=1234261 RepID=A0A815CXU3_9BILA|nr:unnamed protein product [Didymodactylos carnosus]CAF4096978.1 unnamed protein product [Didymodactylos carnosus]
MYVLGEFYWNSTVREKFKNARSLTVLSDQDENECIVVDNASLSTILVNLEQLVTLSQFTHLSYYHSQLDLLEILLDCGTNIESLNLNSTRSLKMLKENDSSKSYSKIKKLKLVDDEVLMLDNVDCLCKLFPSVKSLKVSFGIIDHVYEILPILVEKLTDINYLDIYLTSFEQFDLEPWLIFMNKLFNNFIFDYNKFHIWIWFDK